MNKSRRISLINMCINLVMIVLEIVGIYLLIAKPLVPDVPVGPEMLKYYTVLTAIVTFLAAALMIWANIVSFIKKRDCTPRLFYSMRFLSSVMSLLTFITVIAFLCPFYGTYDVAFSLIGGSIFVHTVCPLLSVVQFVCFEIEPKAKFKKTLEPFIATVIYGVAIIIAVFVINAKSGPEIAAKFAPYFFFWLSPEIAAAGAAGGELGANFLVNIGVAVGVIAVSYVASVLLWLLNRMNHAIFIGEEYQPIGAKKASKRETVTKGNAFANFMKNKVAFGDGSTPSGGQTYHISYHNRKLKTWKVKTENAGRALKVFPTQKEAIDFANDCVKKNGGSIRVHSMLGKIRKE